MKSSDAGKPDMQARLSTLLEKRRFILLDSAMGTELERRGYRTYLPLWTALANLEAPVLIKEIHDENIAAGAQIITANTFRTTSYTFAKAGKAVLGFHVTRLAIEIAREAIMQSGKDVLLAGSLAPLEDCFSPDLVPQEDVIRHAYDEQIDILMESGADFILAETMINRSEILIASALCAQKQIPFMMSFVAENEKILDGTPFDEIIPTVADAAPLALLLNCRVPQVVSENLPALQKLAPGLTGVYGNGPGHPDPHVGWKIEEGSEDDYARQGIAWFNQGARIIGGCCGTTPGMIGRLKQRLQPVGL